MTINQAKFLCSSEKISQCPAAEIEGRKVIEIAFIGRSNVGKSSLINSLTGHSALAKVSSTPGKTRLINHFEIDGRWMLVDLPGYGYAKASKSLRAAFDELIKAYVLQREELHCLFVLVDIRLKPQKIDLQFFDLLGENGIPFAIVFTKGDKLSASARERALVVYKATMAEQWEEFPPHFVTSSETGLGSQALLDYIETML